MKMRVYRSKVPGVKLPWRVAGTTGIVELATSMWSLAITFVSLRVSGVTWEAATLKVRDLDRSEVC